MLATDNRFYTIGILDNFSKKMYVLIKMWELYMETEMH